MLCLSKPQLKFVIDQWLSSDLQKLLRYFNDTAIVDFLEFHYLDLEWVSNCVS